MLVNIFPMILAVVVLLSNRPKCRKTRMAGIFNLVIIFDFLLMLTDVVGMAIVQEIGNLPSSVVWFINVARLVMTTAVTSTWFIYVCYRLRLDINGRWIVIAAVAAEAIADAAVLFVPYRHLASYGLANADSIMRICYLGVSGFGMVMFLLGGIAADIEEVISWESFCKSIVALCFLKKFVPPTIITEIIEETIPIIAIPIRSSMSVIPLLSETIFCLFFLEASIYNLSI